MMITKRQTHNQGLFERSKTYPLEEAVSILKKASPVAFDASVDLQLKLTADPNASEQGVRGTALLPHGSGKNIRVIVLTRDEGGKAALEAGADAVGTADLIEKILKGWMEFDAVVASPSMMREVGKLGKVLGPRGLMPSPKAGTVTENVAQAVREIKRGRIEFKMDKQANLHCSIGKLSFEDQKLVENAKTLLQAVMSSKPKDLKGNLIRSAALSSTMGPGVRLRPDLYQPKEESHG